MKSLILACNIMGLLQAVDFETATTLASYDSNGATTISSFITADNRMSNVATRRDADWKMNFLTRTSAVEDEYAVFLDAGSSGTRMFIYNWTTTVNNTGLVVQQNEIKNCNSVLANFQANPENAGPSLKSCLDFAAQNIPGAKINATRIRLGATAGMRLLHTANPKTAANILSAVHKYLTTEYKFASRPEDVRILTADEESIFMWAAVNYAAKVLTNPEIPANTWTSFYMGGASTDVSTDITPRNNASTIIKANHHITLFNREYPLYVRNFICYGKDQAFLRFKGLLLKKSNFARESENPCGPIKQNITAKHEEVFQTVCSDVLVPPHLRQDRYSLIGSGNYTACREHVFQLFTNNFSLDPSHCPFNDGGVCSLAERTQNFFHGRVLASGGFYYDVRLLQKLSNNSFSFAQTLNVHERRVALQRLCRTRLPELENLAKKYREKLEYVVRLCFDNTYTDLLLTDIYRLQGEVLEQTVFSQSVDGDDVSWTLGWALLTSDNPAHNRVSSVAPIPFHRPTVLVIACLAFFSI